MMRNAMKYCILSLLLVAAAMIVSGAAYAQAKEEAKSDSKADKKIIVRVMSIENGDTAITEHQVDPNDPKVTWVEEDDDGKEVTVQVTKDADKSDSQRSGKDGETVKIVVKEKHDGERGKMDCCSGKGG